MMKPCPLNCCDGSGMLDVHFLKTVVRYPNGSCHVNREKVTREVAEKLVDKLVGSELQSIESAAVSCECRKKFALT